MFGIAIKGKQQILKSRFDSYSLREHCIDHFHITLYLSGFLRAHVYQEPFSK